jgi:exopolyphosphatase/guanosine-5'-triphosphate,3'-diphosphate pyrophosphatase
MHDGRDREERGVGIAAGERPAAHQGGTGAAPAGPVRLAAIDIGTNSVRLMVVDALGTDDYRLVDDEKMTTRLGAGLSASGALSAAASERTFEAVAHLKSIAEGRGATRIAAVATSAVREAANGAAFIARLRDELGLEPEVVSGLAEAELAYLSVQHNFHLPNERVVCLDIGGGSLELIFTVGPVVQEVFSLPLGAVRLTEQFVHSDPVGPRNWKALRRHIRSELARALGGCDLAGTVLIGSGGTISSLARVIAHQRGDHLSRVHGYSTNRSYVKHVLDLFRTLDLNARRNTPGLSPDRADIILAGCAVVNEVLRYLGLNALVVNEHGIREGLIMRMTRQIFGSPAVVAFADWRESVRAFGAACNVDRGPAEHVGGLAVALFDLLADRHGYGEGERRLTAAAAILRNTGHHIGYERHHIHSYHLIRHANLPGFTAREIELIAHIARYHRRALPRKKHLDFSRLARPDRERVRRLGGIVRFVDGLDRSHRQRVKGLSVSARKRHLEVALLADEPVDLELWGGRQKKDLLERAFELVVSLEVRSRAEESGPAGAAEPAAATPAAPAAPAMPAAPAAEPAAATPAATPAAGPDGNGHG